MELLVVIAIIAILAAILFPVFGPAREKARQTQCMSNLHQLGTAFGLYAEDYDGYWPSPGGLAGDYNYWDQSGEGGLTTYVKNHGIGSVWCCPWDLESIKAESSENGLCFWRLSIPDRCGIQTDGVVCL